LRDVLDEVGCIQGGMALDLRDVLEGMCLSLQRHQVSHRFKKIISGKATGHEKLLIKAIKESPGPRQRAPYRDNCPFPPSFVSCK
jgi:hypothetical protein